MLEVSLIAKFLKSESWFEKSHLIKRELKLIIKNRWLKKLLITYCFFYKIDWQTKNYNY